MTINVGWAGVAAALLGCFTPFGIAQIVLYSDVQTVKNNQEILFEYKKESQESKDYAMGALKTILVNQKYIIKELEEEREFRRELQEKRIDFYHLNPHIKRPRD